MILDFHPLSRALGPGTPQRAVEGPVSLPCDLGPKAGVVSDVALRVCVKVRLKREGRI